MFGNMDFASQLIKMMAYCAGSQVKDFSPETPPDPREFRFALKFMLEQSLFFPIAVVEERHKTMLKDKESGLPVRFSRTMQSIEQTPDGKYYIEKDGVKQFIDKDGNRSVREVIKAQTGHIVSQGQANTIKFANISHIWGNASNPFFFSSLWNIALIPSYCNPLMDKLSGDTAVTIQNVYHKVCNVIYGAESMLKQLAGDEIILPEDKMQNIKKVTMNIQSGELSIVFDGQEDEPLNVKVHFLENYNDRSPAVVNATNVVGEDLKSYTETDIKAYKTLWDLKKGTQKSYISYLNSVLKLLKKKELPSFVNRKPKTINNWKSAIESAKAIMSNIEDKR